VKPRARINATIPMSGVKSAATGVPVVVFPFPLIGSVIENDSVVRDT
jgi:hypothetical protein